MLAGIVLLYVGGEALVRGATTLASALGVTPFLIALTVIAFGTSAPELAVAVADAYRGTPTIALGNVIGSNITNIALILGATALVAPVALDRSLIRREMPFLAGSALAMIVLCYGGYLTRAQAVVLLLALGLFLFVLFRGGGSQEEISELEEVAARGELKTGIRATLMTLAGLVMLVMGAQFLVSGAKAMATALGVPEPIIAVTVVALGTSVPELASSVIAALRGHASIALGNVIGSNIFNTLLVLPATVLVREFATPWEIWSFDLRVMGFLSAALVLLMLLTTRISRMTGSLFLLAYVAWIVLTAT